MKAATAASIVLTAGAAVMMIYYTIILPDPLTLRQRERSPVIRILASDGSVLGERGSAHDFVPLDLLPKHVVQAVIATEDRRFSEHWGIDPAGMTRAFFANLRAGRLVQGGSTLTQQLAKNLFLTHDRTMGRKFEELLLAFWLELRLTKVDILELYLNRVYFGAGAYGIESAAQRYFNKSARELTISEAAIIAGLLKAPSRFAPSSNDTLARTRGRSVVDKMLAAGYISAEVAQRAKAEPVRFADTKPASRSAGSEDYVIDAVLDRMPSFIDAGYAEIVVETTIDADLQRRAHAVLSRKLDEKGDALSAGQAALVVIDVDGGVRAMVGGRSYAQSQFNRAVKARRQPGSAFKPFVFLAALESGLTPNSLAYDLPLSIGDWSPRNTDGRFRGAMPLRSALAQSVNTVAVRLQADLGARRVADVARRLGIQSELREDPSLALGTSEVTLAELVGAYGAFANGGWRVAPHTIRRVRTSAGRVLYARNATRTEQVIAPQHVGAMNDMLNAALVGGTGRRAALARHPAAGKTGTTSDFRDAVFVGYTAHFIGGVWTGNDNGRPMNQVTGGGLPAEIWREVMLVAHSGRAPLELPGTARIEPAAPAAQGDPPDGRPVAARAPNQKAAPEKPVASAPQPPKIAERNSGAPRMQRLMQPPPPQLQPVQRGPENDGRSYPRERIDADFIARATQDLPAEERPLMAGVPSGFDFEAVMSRLRSAPEGASPPAGMMALGASPNR